MALALKEGELLLDRYRLISPLGRGGFSVVWLAEDTYTDTRIAVKIYAPDKGLDENGLTQFRKEFKRTRGLRHRNLLVPDHFDILKEANAPFLVMPYCPNGSLQDRFSKDGPASEQDVAAILDQIGGGLAELHRNGVIHQDIKPDNILIGENNRYMLTDFGISRQMRSTLNKATANQSYMTVAYSPPERYRQKPVDTPASDIFSLGVTLYEFCTGEVPWGGVGGMVLNSGAEVPDLPDRYPSRLNAVIRSCMDPVHENRPGAEELAAVGRTFSEEQFWPEIAGASGPSRAAPEEAGSPEARKTQKMESGTPGSTPPPIPRKTRKMESPAPESGIPSGSDRPAPPPGGHGTRRDGSRPRVADSLRNRLKMGNRKVMAAAGGTLVLLMTLLVFTPGLAGLWEKPGAEEFRQGLAYYRDLEYDRAYELFSAAADLEYAEAWYFLGRMERIGEGSLEKNFSEDLFHRGLEGGDLKAHYGLARLYDDGELVERDSIRAAGHYRDAFDAVLDAAEGGEPFWQTRLAYMYSDGNGVMKDERTAVHWFRKAVESAYAPAQSGLAYRYQNGIGVEDNLEEAFRLYRMSAEDGHPPGQVGLGYAYSQGLGVPENDAEAVRWYLKAADQGNSTGMHNLGIMYKNGTGIEQDYEQALYWYEKAAGDGHAGANNSLGVMYENGEGVTEDIQKAEEYYRLAAEGDNMYGWYNLGNLEDQGKGRPYNWTLAAEYYETAARMGHSTANRFLGEMYIFGVGGKQQDIERGKEYLRRAAELEDERARVHLEVLEMLGSHDLYTDTNDSGDRVIVTSSLKEPYIMGGSDNRWNERVSVQFNRATRWRTTSRTYHIDDLDPADELYFAGSMNYYRGRDWNYSDEGSQLVHVKANTPSRSIGYMYVITELDTERVIIKIPMALVWKPE